MEEKKKSKAPIVLLVLILIIAAGAGGFFGGKYYYEQKGNVEEKNTQQKESKEEENVPAKEELDGTVTKEKLELAEKLLLPFDRTTTSCGEKGYFFEKEKYTVDTIDKDVLLLTAYNYARENNTNKTSTGAVEEYADILVKDIEAAVETIYGKNVQLTMPKQINDEYNFESYILKNDRYALEAQGGGCTEYTSSIERNIKSIKQGEKEVIIDVQYLYVIYKEETGENEEVPTFKVYKDVSLTDPILSDISGLKEGETIKELFNSDKANFYRYTFVKNEKGNYILESIVNNKA